MSDKTITHWTCDRCGRAEGFENNAQPSTWRRLLLAGPPRHAEPVKRGDLCQQCFYDLDAWFRRSGVYADPCPECERPVSRHSTSERYRCLNAEGRRIGALAAQ